MLLRKLFFHSTSIPLWLLSVYTTALPYLFTFPVIPQWLVLVTVLIWEEQFELIIFLRFSHKYLETFDLLGFVFFNSLRFDYMTEIFNKIHGSYAHICCPTVFKERIFGVLLRNLRQ